MLEISNFSLIGKDIPTFVYLTIEEVARYYLEMNKDKTRSDFDQNVIEYILRCQEFSGDKATVACFNETMMHKHNLPHPVSAHATIAVIYSLQAQRVHQEQGPIETAWSMIAEARYHLACMYSHSDFKKHIPDILKTQRQIQASIGGKTKAEQTYGLVKKRALELVHTLQPRTGWKSRNSAANTIAEHLHEQKQLSPLSWGQAPKTINKWLTENPDIAKLFRSRTKQPS